MTQEEWNKQGFLRWGWDTYEDYTKYQEDLVLYKIKASISFLVSQDYVITKKGLQ